MRPPGDSAKSRPPVVAPTATTIGVLAATLSPSYGIYSGYEHCENVPVARGSEEYLNSEKYEVKERALDGTLLPLVRKLNEIRRAEPALQRFENLRLLDTHGEHVFAYFKAPDIAVAASVDRPPNSRHLPPSS